MNNFLNMGSELQGVTRHEPQIAPIETPAPSPEPEAQAMEILTAESVTDAGLTLIGKLAAYSSINKIIETTAADEVRDIVFRNYQDDIIKAIDGAFMTKNIAAIEIYCGGGKTIVGAACMAKEMLKYPNKHALFISPNRQAFDHFVADITSVVRKTFGIECEIDDTAGQIKYGTAKIHIKTHDDIVKAYKSNRDAFMRMMAETCFIVVDEAHRYP